ncbi:DUF664 domain-containing protein [Brevibacterium ihuae]|uniref:mycothiol transferase n=1 Tax=Brevibacterium ihuae TaxID=1631743 RepID=UPI000C788815|nr:DUF664 domain-containing protein [Brevibacterium ihuae]
MNAPTPDIPEVHDPPNTGTEREVLLGFLEHARSVLLRKTEGIPAEDPPAPWDTAPWDDDPDWDWALAASIGPDEARSLFIRATERSWMIVESIGGLSTTAARPASDGTTWDLRWVLVHMVEEYNRHLGHADLLRESIDGATGD